MPAFTFYENIPQATDVIAQSQPQLLQNFKSTDGILDVDHYTFESAGMASGDDGYHKQITLPLTTSQGTQSGLASVISSVPGVADSVAAQLILTNSNLSFPLSAVAAFANFAGNVNGSPTIYNSYNVASIATTSANWTSTVTLKPNATTGTGYAVIANCSLASSGSSTDQIVMNYTILSATQFNLKTVNVANNVVAPVNSISFVIFQF